MKRLLLVLLALMLVACQGPDITQTDKPLVQDTPEVSMPEEIVSEMPVDPGVPEMIVEDLENTTASAISPEKTFNFLFQDFPFFFEDIQILTFLEKEPEVIALKEMLEKKGIEVEFANPYDQPKILQDTIFIENPCHFLAEDYLQSDETCDEIFKKGRGLLLLREWDKSKNVLLVTGKDRAAILKAVSVLVNYEDYRLEGDEVTTIVSGDQVLALPTDDW